MRNQCFETCGKKLQEIVYDLHWMIKQTGYKCRVIDCTGYVSKLPTFVKAHSDLQASDKCQRLTSYIFLCWYFHSVAGRNEDDS